MEARKLRKGILAAVVLLSLFWISACKDKKDKFDERVFGRWKITEYYLDNQPAPDTITKYLEGYEYEFAEATPTSQYPDVNGYIKIYYQGALSYFELKTFNNYDGMTLFFKLTTVPPPECTEGSTVSGCFECIKGWDFRFENQQRMEWTGRPSYTYSDSPAQHSHRLLFTKVE